MPPICARPSPSRTNGAPGHNEKAEILEIIGEVSGKTAVVVDDFTISGGTLVNVSTELMDRGAKEVYAVVSHGVFAEQAAQKIDDSPITRLLATDTVENHPNSLPKKIQFVSVAPLFGEAIRRNPQSRKHQRNVPGQQQSLSTRGCARFKLFLISENHEIEEGLDVCATWIEFVDQLGEERAMPFGFRTVIYHLAIEGSDFV